MNISQMHQWFRQYAQQMGMQNVRALLPEQIDLLINTSITDTVKSIIAQSIGVTNDRVITDNSKIGQINALRTLYTVKEIVCYSKKEGKVYLPIAKNVSSSSLLLTGMRFIYNGEAHGIPKGNDDLSFTANFNQKLESLGINFNLAEIVETDSNYCVTLNTSQPYSFTIAGLYGGTWNGDTWTGTTSGDNEALITGIEGFSLTDEGIYPGLIKASISELVADYMYFVDFAINYTKASTGLRLDNNGFPFKISGDLGFTTNYFPVRLIDDVFLADVLNDFVLKPRLRTPITVIYGDTIDLYIESFKKSNNSYFLTENLIPYKFRISYIAKPNVVAYREDINGTNVDCNLPEYLHEDILKHAVDLYRASITGSVLGQQEQMRQQQQEVARNEGNPYANSINNNNNPNQ